MNHQTLHRRRFLQSTGLVAGAFSLAPRAEEQKSLVVEAHRPGVIDADNRPDPVGTQEMLDRAMQALTGEKSRCDQWARFVKIDEVIGLKVNGLGGPLLSTRKELLLAIIRGLTDFGVKENNVIVWDNRAKYIKNVGLETNLGDTGVRVYSTDHPEIGHDEERTEFGADSTHLSKILTEQIDALINVPIMKDHRRAGTTLSLKNLSHGITDNPNKHHSNCCDPYIGEINAIPVVCEKHRLVVMDALRGGCDGGPGYKPDAVVNYESLYVSTDRVAIDTVGSERVAAARKEKGLAPIEEIGRPTKYLVTAERLGLGHHNKAKIDHQTVAG